jgi:hypothetical protein
MVHSFANFDTQLFQQGALAGAVPLLCDSKQPKEAALIKQIPLFDRTWHTKVL